MWSFVFGAYLAVLLYFPVDYSWLGVSGRLRAVLKGVTWAELRLSIRSS